MKELIASILRKILGKFPYVKFLEKNYQDMLLVSKDLGHAPGHFYSTIPSQNDIIKNNNKVYDQEKILDINLYFDEQVKLLLNFKKYYDIIPYNFVEEQESTLRYSAKEAQYRFSDVICLFSIINEFKPQRIIEVGSGHSSAVMLDTNELLFENSIDLTFIEPYPENRLLQILRPNDITNSTIIKKFVQDVDIKHFQKLEKNDILFVDSSHVCKLGSDLNHILFNILPILNPGVLIHFHDIFHPFEMPKSWINDRKWFWNENYFLRAFLMNNNSYKTVLFNSMLHLKHKDWIESNMPNCLIGSDETGSIWIKKT